MDEYQAYLDGGGDLETVDQVVSYDASLAKRSHEVTVEVTDALGVSDDATVRVSLAEQNDPPVMTCPSTATVAENSVASTDVTQILAEDPDNVGNGDQQVISFSIAAGNFGGAFTIDSASGAITTSGQLDLDFGGVSSRFELVVVGTDGYEQPRENFISLQGTCTVSVVITDVNERPSIQAEVRGAVVLVLRPLPARSLFFSPAHA